MRLLLWMGREGWLNNCRWPFICFSLGSSDNIARVPIFPLKIRSLRAFHKLQIKQNRDDISKSALDEILELERMVWIFSSILSERGDWKKRFLSKSCQEDKASRHVKRMWLEVSWSWKQFGSIGIPLVHGDEAVPRAWDVAFQVNNLILGAREEYQIFAFVSAFPIGGWMVPSRSCEANQYPNLTVIKISFSCRRWLGM